VYPLHREGHLIERIGWLRAAVLGANDGIISTSSLVIGVAAASTSPNEVIVAGIAGLVAGATAMAAGEYVSVSSQADTETADLAKERRELADQPEAELDELTNIYVQRGLDISLARQVAEALTAKDAFATHARDELGLSAHVIARPVQAALTSAITFAFGAAIPLLIAIASPTARIPWAVSAGSLVALAILGAAGAQTGGASVLKPMLRVTFWGAIAMGTTAAVGRLVGHAL
jgi:VIT1/CCC1 family predicted Fe2+/Mn2+ transporter